jgi:hypothetical protein
MSGPGAGNPGALQPLDGGWRWRWRTAGGVRRAAAPVPPPAVRDRVPARRQVAGKLK